MFPIPNASHDLTGRVALVTGAGGALGRRFAQVLASCGASVAVADIRLDTLDATADSITDAGGTCHASFLDLTEPASIPTFVDDIESSLGQIDILVNNAGTNDPGRPQKVPFDVVNTVVCTNLSGPFALTCEVGRRLIESETPGNIVNISSIAAYVYTTRSASAMYSITKAAVARMTETLAVEWARYNINVNAIAPGIFHSDMTQGMIDRMGDLSDQQPRKRLGVPPQLDSTLLFLVSRASECVTGTIIKVDDGQKSR
jgi:NAD(P)-dependent dehydrogenase (short-subunit alcohol dehydrogenase family)